MIARLYHPLVTRLLPVALLACMNSPPTSAEPSAAVLTQRLILQPQTELNIYSKADPSRLVGVGLSNVDTGLRLRYEFSRTFAPYLAVVYQGKFGQTANFARRAGESTGDVRVVFGIRTWF